MSASEIPIIVYTDFLKLVQFLEMLLELEG